LLIIILFFKKDLASCLCLPSQGLGILGVGFWVFVGVWVFIGLQFSIWGIQDIFFASLQKIPV